MSTSPLLSLGMRAMFANQAALQTIGQNIANANTAGYSRQEVVLTTPEGQFTGAGYFGKGVNVQTVTRSHNEFLTREAAAAKSQAFADTTCRPSSGSWRSCSRPARTAWGSRPMIS